MIAQQLLLQYGATIELYTNSQNIFSDGSQPKYYYQIIYGKVKILHTDAEGKDFIHDIVSNDQSFGDMMLFINELYPFSAVSCTEVKLLKLRREDFILLLEENHAVCTQFNKFLAEHLYRKMLLLHSNSSTSAEDRLHGIFNYLDLIRKNKTTAQTEDSNLTRGELASFTGLRTETVIRTLNKMGPDIRKKR